MNDLKGALKIDEWHKGVGGRHIIPLPYYSVENIEVSDEVLSFEVPLSIDDLAPGGTYNVRLLLYGPDRLYRVVQRIIVAA